MDQTRRRRRCSSARALRFETTPLHDPRGLRAHLKARLVDLLTLGARLARRARSARWARLARLRARHTWGRPLRRVTPQLQLPFSRRTPLDHSAEFRLTVPMHADQSLRSSRRVTIPLALRAAPVSLLSPSAGERELQANPTMMDRLPSMFNTKSKPLLVQLGASAAPTEDTIFQAINRGISLSNSLVLRL